MSLSNEDHLHVMHLVKEGKLTVEQAQALLADTAGRAGSPSQQQHAAPARRSTLAVSFIAIGNYYDFFATVYTNLGKR